MRASAFAEQKSSHGTGLPSVQRHHPAVAGEQRPVAHVRDHSIAPLGGWAIVWAQAARRAEIGWVVVRTIVTQRPLKRRWIWIWTGAPAGPIWPEKRTARP